MGEQQLKIGDVVTYRDETGVEHNGLVTAVHGPDCINVAFLSADETKRDSYGRQVERDSSVQRQSDVTAPNGRYFNS